MSDPDEDVAARAQALFHEGFNCAEAVLRAMEHASGRSLGDAHRMATAFGGGLARQGLTCGAITGAAMAVGVLAGRERAEETDAKEQTYAIAARIVHDLETACGAVTCRALTGLDFTASPADKDEEQRVQREVCMPVLALVVRSCLAALRDAGALPPPPPASPSTPRSGSG